AGDFIQEVRNDTVVAREGHASVIDIGMVEITGYAAALTHERSGVRPAGVRKVLGVVITEEKLQAFRQALVDGDRERVVVATPASRHIIYRIPKRVRSAPDRPGKSYGVGRHLVEILAQRQIGSMAAIVGNAQTGLEAEITLDGEVPLLDIGIPVVEIVGLAKVLRARLGEICREGIRERVLCLSILDGIGEAGHVTRRHAPRSQDRVAKRRVDIFSVSTAEHRLAVRGGAPGKANTGSEVRFLRITQAV